MRSVTLIQCDNDYSNYSHAHARTCAPCYQVSAVHNIICVWIASIMCIPRRNGHTYVHAFLPGGYIHQVFLEGKLGFCIFWKSCNILIAFPDMFLSRKLTSPSPLPSHTLFLPHTLSLTPSHPLLHTLSPSQPLLRAQILRHSAKMELLKQNYVNQLTNALRDQQKYSPGSPEV